MTVGKTYHSKRVTQSGMAMAEVMIAAIIFSAISATIVMAVGQQTKSFNAMQVVADRDRTFDSLTRTLQNEVNVRHSLDNGSVYPPNDNTGLSSGNRTLAICVHNTGPCNPNGTAQTRPDYTLPEGGAAGWISFVLVRPAGNANAAGVIPFARVAGTETNPVRYRLDGRVCTPSPATPTADCPLEAVSYARVQCSTPGCTPADSLSFTVVLRHGMTGGNYVQIRSSAHRSMAPKVLNAVVNFPRTVIARRGVNAMNCPDIVVGGKTTQQRMIGIGPSGQPLCGAVDTCPEGTYYAGNNRDGSPNCQRQAQQKCRDNQEYRGFADDSTGNIICQDRAKASCPAGTISIGIDPNGNPICSSLDSGRCYETTSACDTSYVVQSYSLVCREVDCGKKSGCRTVCDKASKCCRPNSQ